MTTLAGNNPITANGVFTLETFEGKEYFIRTSGTPNGAAVKLEYVSDISNSNVELDGTNTSWSNTVGGAVFLAPAETMQLNVTSAGGSTNIAIDISQIG